jgi:hypothetical protein
MKKLMEAARGRGGGGRGGGERTSSASAHTGGDTSEGMLRGQSSVRPLFQPMISPNGSITTTFSEAHIDPQPSDRCTIEGERAGGEAWRAGGRLTARGSRRRRG